MHSLSSLYDMFYNMYIGILHIALIKPKYNDGINTNWGLVKFGAYYFILPIISVYMCI